MNIEKINNDINKELNNIILKALKSYPKVDKKYISIVLDHIFLVH